MELARIEDRVGNCKAYPDEKGIETQESITVQSSYSDCKAYPDEKGIETPDLPGGAVRGLVILQSLSR